MESMKKIIFVSLLFFLVSFLLLSCNNERKEEPIESPLPPEQGSITPEQGSMVFLDTSVSMRGYFRTSDTQATTIQRFLRAELHNIIGINNLSPIYLSRFEATVTDPEEQFNIGNMFVFRPTDDLNQTNQISHLFSGLNTDIIGVFNNENFGKYSVSIIITDGVQSDPGGFDIGRMLNAIETKIDGLHIYLIGIKSEFNGLVYPEHPNSQGLTPRFRHNDLRPIYIWIVTPDGETGSKLTNAITAKFGDIGANNRVNSISFTDIQLPKISDIEIITDQAPYRVIPRGEDLIEIKLANSLRDSKYVDIPVRIAGNSDGTERQLWKLEMRLDKQWAEVIDTDDGWYLSLDYKRTPNSGFIFGRQDNHIKVKVMALPDVEKWWWRQWNTDDDSNREDADKTLHLKNLVEKFIEPLYNKEYEVKSFNLRIVK